MTQVIKTNNTKLIFIELNAQSLQKWYLSKMPNRM